MREDENSINFSPLTISWHEIVIDPATSMFLVGQ